MSAEWKKNGTEVEDKIAKYTIYNKKSFNEGTFQKRILPLLYTMIMLTIYTYQYDYDDYT